ncbi:hypothetical protein [Roseateles sp.]|uniref:hypothetical protein n=1 Tax=Roseateles sp. TaxID=1971397 RepID=UPI002F40C525
MSQILTVSPTLVHDLWIAGVTATVTAAVCWYVQRFKRFAVDEDKAIIKAVVGGEQAWHAAHRERFERAYASLGEQPKTAEPAPLALSDRSHADEQADHTDTDRAGMWRVLAGLARDTFDAAARGVGAAVVWPVNAVRRAAASWRRRRDERYLIGSGEQAVDPSQPLREVLAASGYELDEEPSEAEERELLDTAWADANPPTNPAYKSHRCPYGTVAKRDSDYLSRHTHPDFKTGAYEVINPNIPAQRTGGEA